METLIIIGHGGHDDSKLNLNGTLKINQLCTKLKDLLPNFSEISPLIITSPDTHTLETGEAIASIFKETKVSEFGELMWNKDFQYTQAKFPQIFEIIELLRSSKSVVIIIPSSVLGTRSLLEFLSNKYLSKQPVLPVKDLWCGEFYLININKNKIEHFYREKILQPKHK